MKNLVVCNSDNYSSREAPSLKMGSDLFIFVLFLGDRLLVIMLIGWRAINNHVLCLWAKYGWADDSKGRNVGK